MMEKRVMLAAGLSVAFLALYTKFVLEPQAARRPVPVKVQTEVITPAATTPVISSEKTSLHPIPDEDVISISNGGISLDLGRQSAALHEATVHLPQDPAKIVSQFPLFSVQLPDERLSWQVKEQAPNSAQFSALAKDGTTYTLTYAIAGALNVVDVTLSASGSSKIALITNTWTRADALTGNQNVLEMVASGPKNGGVWYKKLHAKKDDAQNVPRGTFLVTLTERYFTQSLRHVSGLAQVQLLGSPEGTLAAESSIDLSSPYQGKIYLGPRDYFYLKAAGFADAFKIGMMGQIGIILIMILQWIEGVTKNYGIAIILLSALITGAMAPFTLISMRSMKKMQSLKPEMDRIMAKHKGNPTKANQEVMALYKEHKVSPISGCLPMMLQIPIFIALLQAITHFIGFRGEKFLWISDLSFPDRAFELPMSLPFLGAHVNILPIVMAFLMYFQTKMSSQNMAPSGPNQPPNLMAGPIMPVIFGVMFYQFPSALVLYWLTNSAISIGTYRLVR